MMIAAIKKMLDPSVKVLKRADKLADEAYEADVRKYWGAVGNKADEIIENYYKTKYGSDYQNHMKK